MAPVERGSLIGQEGRVEGRVPGASVGDDRQRIRLLFLSAVRACVWGRFFEQQVGWGQHVRDRCVHHGASSGAAFHHLPGTGPRPAVSSEPFLALALVSISSWGVCLSLGGC